MEMNVLLHEEDNESYKLLIEATLSEYKKNVSQSNTTTCVKIHHSELTWLKLDQCNNSLDCVFIIIIIIHTHIYI